MGGITDRIYRLVSMGRSSCSADSVDEGTYTRTFGYWRRHMSSANGHIVEIRNAAVDPDGILA
jgi:hypothetical protein